MTQWDKKTLSLKDGHGWEGTPGCKVFVADRGAVRFDYPEDWVVVPDEKGSIKFHDREPPDDDCTLQMTVFYLNPQLDLSRLPPVSEMLKLVLDEDTRFVLDRKEIVSFRRGRTEVAWSELRFMDPNEARPAFSRICLCRCRTIQPIITFDYWESDAPRMRKAWDTIMATMRLGETITDPTRGPDRRDRPRDLGRGQAKGKGKRPGKGKRRRS